MSMWFVLFLLNYYYNVCNNKEGNIEYNRDDYNFELCNYWFKLLISLIYLVILSNE